VPNPRDLPSVEAAPPELVKRALAFRPDLRAAELNLEAAGERAGLAPWEVLALSAMLDANEEGEDGFELGPGLAVEIPIFDWNQGGRALAEANLQLAARHYAAVHDQIVLDVREAHARYCQVREELTAWRGEILPSIEASHALAEKAYHAGDTSLLPLLAWKNQYLEGRLQEAKLTADLHIATARLERGVGGRLDRDPTAVVTEEE
jgi:cobalt-zinc-cadmium efflux system outer membrane protein